MLVNLLNKDPAQLFAEFEGKQMIGSGSGDVKYHMGYSSNLETPAGSLHVALAYNPSHLEIVNPVVLGQVRARQERRGENGQAQVVGYSFTAILHWAVLVSTKPRLTYRRPRATVRAARYIW